MTKVIAAKANDDFTLDLKFDDGSVKRFDIKPYLDYEVFQELKDLDYCKQGNVAFGNQGQFQVHFSNARSASE